MSFGALCQNKQGGFSMMELSNGASPGRQKAGFSALELLVSLAIVLIIAVFGIPQLLNATAFWKVRNAAADLSGLIQQGRMLAEKQNTTLAVYTGSVESSSSGAFVNCSLASTTPCSSGGNGSSWQSGDPEIVFPGSVTNAPASSAPATVNPGFTPESAGTVLYFSSRGLPVKSSGTTYVLTSGFVFYLTDGQHWAAVSVSAAGRSKVWVFNGTAWS
jgi:prepilin-type N-terminal cleavage/methylation domain-containing protein